MANHTVELSDCAFEDCLLVNLVVSPTIDEIRMVCEGYVSPDRRGTAGGKQLLTIICRILYQLSTRSIDAFWQDLALAYDPGGDDQRSNEITRLDCTTVADGRRHLIMKTDYITLEALCAEVVCLEGERLD